MPEIGKDGNNDPIYETLTFDVVSLSHWDKDHFWGLIDWMTYDCNWTFYPLDGDNAFQNAKCDRFKYAADGTPGTRFYCSANNQGKHASNFSFTEPPYTKFKVEDPVGKLEFRRKVLATRSAPAQILGANLFSGTLPADRSKCTDLDNLVQQNDPWVGSNGETWTGAPALYAVGIDQVLVGPTDFFVIDDDSSSEEVLNAGSIILLLVWKGSGTTPNRVAFYTAGDAEFKEENRLIPGLNGKTIDVVKAGHHGSRIGTSTTFIEAVNPMFFLISGGREHGHPVLEIIWYLDSWFTSAQGRRVVKDDKGEGTLLMTRIYATCFPYYFGLKNFVTGKLGYVKSRYTTPKTYDYTYTANAAWLKYRNVIKSHYPTDLSPTPLDALNTTIKDQVYGDQVETLADQSRKLWVKWSPTGDPYYPIGSSIAEDHVASISKVVTSVHVIFNADGKITTELMTDNFTWNFPTNPPKKTAKKGKRKYRSLLSDPKLFNLPVGDGNRPPRLTIAPNGEPVYPEALLDVLYRFETAGDLDYGTPNNPGPKETIQRQQHLTPAVKPASIHMTTYLFTFGQIVPYGSPAANAFALEPSSDEDYFVHQLRHRSITIQPEITVKTANDSWLARVSSDDEFASWWSTMFANGSTSTITISGAGSEISSINLQFNPFGKSHLGVNFSSSGTTLRNVFHVSGSSLASVVGNNGFFKDRCTLVLALDYVITDDSFCMTELFDLIERDIPAWFAALVSNEISLRIQTTRSDQHPAVNAMWYSPAADYNSCIQISAVEDTKSTSTGLVQCLAKLLPNCDFGVPNVVATKTVESYFQTDLTSKDVGAVAEYRSISASICIHTTIQLSSQDSTTGKNFWDAYLSVNDTDATVIMQWNSDTDALSSFLGWVEDRIGLKDLFKPFGNILSDAESAAHLTLRQVMFKVDQNNGTSSFDSFAIGFEVDLDWGIPSTEDPDQRVPCLLTFSWQRVAPNTKPIISFRGRLWPASMKPDQTEINLLHQEQPPWPVPRPTAKKPRKSFSLLGLPGNKDILSTKPNSLQLEATSLELELSTQTISFSGALAVGDTAIGDAPPLPIATAKLNASFGIQSKALTIGFDVTAYLEPKTENDIQVPYPTAKLEGTLAYTTGLWILSARAESVSGATLRSLLPSNGEHDAAAALLQDLYIPTFELSYTYSGGAAKLFTATGMIELGNVLYLGLNFTYGSSKAGDTQWTISADLAIDHLGTKSTTVQLGGFLTSISGPLKDLIPQFVQDMEFTVTDKSKIHLLCQKADKDMVISGITATVEEFEFSFVQMTKKGAGSSKKQLFRFEVDQLPEINTIPMLASLSQPFDRMEFFWLSDGLTGPEIDMVNATFFTDFGYRITKVDPPPPKKNVAADAVVLSSGSHFMIVVDENGRPTVILDYDFACKPGHSNGSDLATKSASNKTSDAGTKSAPFALTVGSLSVSGIGLALKDGELSITLSASVSIGPIQGQLNNFAISIPTSNLHKLSATDLKISISGIGLGFVEPPLEIAGLLIKKDADTWEGGVTIKYEPYTFMAGGLYAKVPKPKTTDTFKTAFVFARLDGPVVELELATVSGVTGGFGYNSRMTLPTIDNVTQFPFLRQNLDPQPLQVLNSFLDPVPIQWFTPTDGDLWIAAGLTCTAFQILSVQAVATISFSPGVLLGVFANCTAKVPDTPSDSDEGLFVIVEMGLLAIMDPGKGVFQVQGQLTPRSFVLDPSCHLSGGFAVCYWFGPSGYSGDWVMTLGGYHSAFKVPSHYPVPPRLGISWNFDSEITISGTAYFAITPKACMGGGTLSLDFDADLLHAWFDAWADFLVNFRPFKFVGDIGLDIGITFSINMYICTLSWSIDFSASVHLEGPPMAGFVYVDWDIISFTIHFGNSNAKNDALTWDLMWQLLTQQASSSANVEASNSQPHVIAAVRGLTSDKPATIKVSEEGADTWLVDRSTFGFSIKALFPIRTFTYELTSSDTVVCTFNGPPTYVKPMHTQKDQKATSVLHLQIVTSDGVNAIFQAKPIVELVPLALWDLYDPLNDPNQGATPSNLLDTSGPTMPQLMGISLLPAPPLSPDTMQPFQAVAACSYNVFLPAEAFQPKIPEPGSPSFAASWVPKAQASTDDPRSEWSHPKFHGEDLLKAWTGLLDGGKSGFATKQYQNVDASLPSSLLTDEGALDRWNDCFPVAPRISTGSGV